ncbi:hypothetical protein Y032_0053g2395 [Ancylostoma ceylanicum]|uniref:Peptidase M12A domain-containing protein n=1 Tax=Ancylostoma ceylanicum TaxID=53326 RepID=A0A016U8N6_9BILA|nr:hypothetical protein Y032_0053g2395 [Ancylostoma ceylanicum]
MNSIVLLCFCAFVVNGDDRLRNPLWEEYKDDDGKFVIPYVINGTYGEEKKILFEMMDEIDKNTCVRFSPRIKEQDYIEIVNEQGLGELQTVVDKEQDRSFGCLLHFPNQQEITTYRFSPISLPRRPAASVQQTTRVHAPRLAPCL